ncbi:conserved hypothetical protein [Candida dubliniensis CD36]|uniref:Uncharacterized protein n=1 Tax=Candida dubliniensis (strain CD36 / ATCC MYA-646 / CBS 7987 / NCPF 3949 / NRRL Y-17841) TaxID=573826 RepID=B9WLS2_CANDC|nr:conserved hypothetical protein [Candida dubliniensis CD36]CAX40034.1 conserved hypothetical protein [Candida dubliniensis CD36]
MFGNQITERKGLDLTIPYSSTTTTTTYNNNNKKSIFKLLFIGLIIISSGIFLYSSTTTLSSYYPYKQQQQQSTNSISNIPAKIDFDAPLSEPTNIVEQQINKRYVESIDLEYIIKRDDSNNNNKDDDNNNNNNNNKDDSKKKSKPIYDQPGMRFVFALFAFVILNMIAICIHHIYMKITNSVNAYKTVNDDISPF